MARIAEGVQTPVQTLHLRSGSCRDFALLMIEAIRALGMVARFVSGYLYRRRATMLEPRWGRDACLGSVYLPGSGWIEFDPTNGVVGNRNLIRVAVVGDPSQAAPISGTWTGAASDFLGMSVDVSVVSGRRPCEACSRDTLPPRGTRSRQGRKPLRHSVPRKSLSLRAPGILLTLRESCLAYRPRLKVLEAPPAPSRGRQANPEDSDQLT